MAVRGLHFKAGERVRLTLLAPSVRVLRATAKATGTFTARFAGVSADRCSTLQIQAIGAGGSRAFLNLKPLCPPP